MRAKPVEYDYSRPWGFVVISSRPSERKGYTITRTVTAHTKPSVATLKAVARYLGGTAVPVWR